MLISRRLHGRRGLKYRVTAWRGLGESRRLHGRRGLKFCFSVAGAEPQRSPPSRAAWIEMPYFNAPFSKCFGRRLHGRRGLKSEFVGRGNCHARRRRLHGRRGLKYASNVTAFDGQRRRLHGRRGLKLLFCLRSWRRCWSPPSRAAWIEIVGWNKEEFKAAVAAFTGGVD